MRPRPPIYAILILSASALAYEVVLMRLFSIIQWHHFAYMVISLALLGYGASGTFLSLTRQWLLPHYEIAFSSNAALFGISSLGCFLLAQQLPFNTLEIFWDPGQWWLLMVSYLLLFIPVFFAANCTCLALDRFTGQIPRIYAFNMAGAGLGALGVIAALYLLTPIGVLRLLAMGGLLAAVLALLEHGYFQRRILLAGLLAMMLAIPLLPSHWLTLKMSEYKSLNQTLQISGTVVKEQHTSPLGLITLVESPQMPLRVAPGLSLNSTTEPPPQLGLFIDGEGPSAINRYDGRAEPLRYLDYLTSALPYHLGPRKRVLILGLGGGSDLLQAELLGAARIDAVELNPQLVELFQQRYRDYSGWPLLQHKSKIHISEARSFIAGSREQYDLIQISLLDSAAASSAGLHALSESYLYTREGITEYLDHLTTGGMLAITRWVKLPPRDGLKLFATAVEALRHRGVAQPAERLAMIRGWSTSTLLIKNNPFTSREIESLIRFSQERAFDTVYFPGISPSEVNHYNILSEPYFYQGAVALLGEQPELFYQRYKFDIRPATDDRPYFFNFFKWSTLPELLAIYRQGGFSLLELGYPVLVLTLLQALAASLVLILLPLQFLTRNKGPVAKSYTWRTMAFFTAIGLAYLFVEIAFIQKFTLFLAHPIFAVTLVLCGFLVFSGIGSHYAGRLLQAGRGRPLLPATLAITLFAMSYLWLLPHLLPWLSTLPDPAKAVIALLLIAPLAFCMGMPFPVGLTQVARHAPALLPWAWGVNGCASLLSAILATLLAVHFGFNWVIVGAVLLYAGAALLPLKE